MPYSNIYYDTASSKWAFRNLKTKRVRRFKSKQSADMIRSWLIRYDRTGKWPGRRLQK